jgi:hypothetical protein
MDGNPRVPNDMRLLSQALRGRVRTLLSTTVVPALVASTAGLLLGASSAQAQVVFSSGFEDGTINGFSAEGCCNSLVEAPVRAGKKAIKFESKPDARRAEVKTKTDDGKTGEERWFSYSVYLPKDWLTDPKAAIVTQWHERPDPCEDWRSPPLAMAYVDGKVRLTRKWDSKPCSTSPTGEGQKVFYLEPMDVEKWTDWVFHVKWSHKEDGLIEVWRDGKKVVTEMGPNTYNDQRPNYLKIGMYNFQGSTKDRVVYYDEIKVGGPGSTYEQMVPGSGAPPVPLMPTSSPDGGVSGTDANPEPGPDAEGPAPGATADAGAAPAQPPLEGPGASAPSGPAPGASRPRPSAPSPTPSAENPSMTTGGSAEPTDRGGGGCAVGARSGAGGLAGVFAGAALAGLLLRVRRRRNQARSHTL